jgi:hypothetical protein
MIVKGLKFKSNKKEVVWPSLFLYQIVIEKTSPSNIVSKLSGRSRRATSRSIRIRMMTWTISHLLDPGCPCDPSYCIFLEHIYYMLYIHRKEVKNQETN